MLLTIIFVYFQTLNSFAIKSGVWACSFTGFGTDYWNVSIVTNTSVLEPLHPVSDNLAG